MATVRLVVATTKKQLALVSEALFRAGAAGLEERPGRTTLLVTYGDSKQGLAALWRRAEKLLQGSLVTLPRATFEIDREERWRTSWTEHLHPVELTPRLVLAPATSTTRPPVARGQRLIVYRPALAFGDGDHATTRLAARAIEKHYRGRPGGALLDIGAGTGVLSFVAALSGARRALGTDIDPEALRAATHNAKLNQLGKQTRFVPAGARISGPFDLGVVNIELRPLLQVLTALPAAARRVPRLLVTGILTAQVPQVTSALKAAGFRARRLAREGDWVLLDARP